VDSHPEGTTSLTDPFMADPFTFINSVLPAVEPGG